ncbi:MAG: hypothetical protein ACTSRU_09485 [Candidatus Hodarchaeales archaeon]
MNPLSARILGWSITTAEHDMMRFNIDLEYNYPMSLIVYYIQTGQFRTENPFGLNDEDQNLVLESDVEPSLITFSNNPVKNFELTEERCNEKGNGILALTSLFSALIKEGYCLPLQSSSFLGKSKGHARDTRNPIVTFRKRVLETEVEFEIHEAESFEIIRRNNEDDLVLYDPRHAIYEAKFNLDSKGFIPEEIINHEVMRRTINSVSERFQHINEVIKSHLTQNVQTTPLSLFESSLILGPIFKIPDGHTIDLTNTQETRFEEILTTTIKNSIGGSPSLIVIEESLSDVMSEGPVQEFIDLLNSIEGREIKVLHLKDSTDVSQIDSPAILILDDRNPDVSGFRHIIKCALTHPNKVFLYSTIAKKDVQQLNLLARLAIRHRKSGCLYQSIIDDPFNYKIGMSFSMAFQGRYYRLGGALIHDNKVITKRELITRSSDPISSAFIRFLEEFLSSTKKERVILYIDNESIVDSNFLSYIENNDITLAIVKQSNSVILHANDSEESLPMDGQYVKLSNLQYLMITNGVPNNPVKGIPSPIIIKVFNQKQVPTILQSIFWDTFIHPTSLKKTKLPLPLYIARIAARRNTTKHLVGTWKSSEGVL